MVFLLDVIMVDVEWFTDDGFDMIHKVGERYEGELAFEMGILRQMTTGVAIPTISRRNTANVLSLTYSPP